MSLLSQLSSFLAPSWMNGATRMTRAQLESPNRRALAVAAAAATSSTSSNAEPASSLNVPTATPTWDIEFHALSMRRVLSSESAARYLVGLLFCVLLSFESFLLVRLQWPFSILFWQTFGTFLLAFVLSQVSAFSARWRMAAVCPDGVRFGKSELFQSFELPWRRVWPLLSTSTTWLMLISNIFSAVSVFLLFNFSNSDAIEDSHSHLAEQTSHLATGHACPYGLTVHDAALRSCMRASHAAAFVLFGMIFSAVLETITVVWLQEGIVKFDTEDSTFARLRVWMPRIAGSTVARSLFHSTIWYLLFVAWLASPLIELLRLALRLCFHRLVLSSKPFHWSTSLSLLDFIHLIVAQLLLHCFWQCFRAIVAVVRTKSFRFDPELETALTPDPDVPLEDAMAATAVADEIAFPALLLCCLQQNTRPLMCHLAYRELAHVAQHDSQRRRAILRRAWPQISSQCIVTIKTFADRLLLKLNQFNGVTAAAKALPANQIAPETNALPLFGAPAVAANPQQSFFAPQVQQTPKKEMNSTKAPVAIDNTPLLAKWYIRSSVALEQAYQYSTTRAGAWLDHRFEQSPFDDPLYQCDLIGWAAQSLSMLAVQAIQELHRDDALEVSVIAQVRRLVPCIVEHLLHASLALLEVRSNAADCADAKALQTTLKESIGQLLHAFAPYRKLFNFSARLTQHLQTFN